MYVLHCVSRSISQLSPLPWLEYMTMVGEPEYGSVLLITVCSLYSIFQDALHEHPMFVMSIFI